MTVNGSPSLPAFPPAGLWSRYGVVIEPTEEWELAHPGEADPPCQESTFLYDSDDKTWKTWWSARNGVGYATSQTILAKPGYPVWQKYGADTVPTTALPTNASFETAGEDGVPTGWSLTSNVGGTPTLSLVAGRTGGYALRVQYTCQAGDTGKGISLDQWLAAGPNPGESDVQPGEWIVPRVWLKGTLGTGVTLTNSCGLQPNPWTNAEETYMVPTASWAQWWGGFKADPSVTGGMHYKPIQFYFASDSGSLDVTFDDCSIDQTINGPVKSGPNTACSFISVTKVDGTFHMFAGSYACLGGVDAAVPVDLHIRGCPPDPAALLEGLLALVESSASR